MFVKPFHSSFLACMIGDTLFDDAENVQPTFDTLSTLSWGRVKGPPHWHRNGNTSHLARRSLATAIAIGDAFTRDCIAMKVRFYSTLVHALHCMRVTQKTNNIIFFQCDEVFKDRSPWHSKELRRAWALAQSTWALVPILSSVLLAANGTKYSVFTLYLGSCFYNDNYYVGGVVISSTAKHLGKHQMCFLVS